MSGPHVLRACRERRRGGHRLTPPVLAWAVLVMGAIAAVVVAQAWGAMVANDQARRFADHAATVEQEVSLELTRYQDLLISVGMVHASTPSTDFAASVADLGLYARLPGLVSVSFEPQGAGGAQRGSGPNATSLRVARAAGVAIVTPLIGANQTHPGFLVNLPITTKAGSGREFAGWVRAEINSTHLFSGLFGYQELPVGFTLFVADGAQPASEAGSWPTKTDASAVSAVAKSSTSTIRVFDGQWTLVTRTLPQFVDASERTRPLTVFLVAMVGPIFAFGLVWALSRSRKRALRAVDEATSELRAREEQLAHQATHDPLTGLPNRRLLNDRLALALARSDRSESGVAVFFMDLDRFKEINDTLGHDIGDEVLHEVAARLRSAVRPHDTVARMGGDEFVILCDDLHAPDEATAISERILSALDEPMLVSTGTLLATGSLGSAIHFSGEPIEPESMLQAADASMYESKRERRTADQLPLQA